MGLLLCGYFSFFLFEPSSNSTSLAGISWCQQRRAQTGWDRGEQPGDWWLCCFQKVIKPLAAFSFRARAEVFAQPPTSPDLWSLIQKVALKETRENSLFPPRSKCSSIYCSSHFGPRTVETYSKAIIVPGLGQSEWLSVIYYHAEARHTTEN